MLIADTEEEEEKEKNLDDENEEGVDVLIEKTKFFLN